MELEQIQDMMSLTMLAGKLKKIRVFLTKAHSNILKAFSRFYLENHVGFFPFYFPKV